MHRKCRVLPGFVRFFDWQKNYLPPVPICQYCRGMKSTIMAKTVDKRQKNRRYRDILANSGLLMESGEVRDLPNLYVMSYDGDLINVNDLAKDPEKQTEQYAVKAQADHGETTDDGYSVPTVEKQFGSCRVWTEDDGLHARIYFANDQDLADHLFAISDDASYSIGTEWAEPGYEWNGKVYEDTIGILREISMVITGNDPRARTIDQKAEVKGSKGATNADGDNNKGEEMSKTKKDALTPDERAAMMRRLNEAVDEIIDDFTTNAPESETEPTARDNAEAEGETKTEVPEEKKATSDKKDSKRVGMPFVVINKTDSVKNETVAQSDKQSGKWLATDAGKAAFRKALDACGRSFGPQFDAQLKAAAKQDGITGLAAPAPTEQVFVDTFEKRDGILNHVRTLNVRSYRVNILTAGEGEEGRAHGHKKGDQKIDQALTATQREVLTKMVYKKLTLDAQELYENPELYDIRREELIEAIFAAIEQAIVTGDGRSEPGGGDPDYRLFDGTRGFWSIVADAEGETALATAITGTAGENLYDARIDAYPSLKAEGRRIMVAKGSVLAAVRKQKTADGGYLVAPGASLENALDVDRIYSPSWMESASVDAVIFVENAYTVIGEVNQVREKTSFDTDTNGDVLLIETPRGGSLTKALSAVTITLTAA